jgi:hypothetical protein
MPHLDRIEREIDQRRAISAAVRSVEDVVNRRVGGPVRTVLAFCA